MAKGNSISSGRAYFEQLLDDDPQKSTGLAAIETLMKQLTETQGFGLVFGSVNLKF